ncbi:hypothetical protein SLEP1_g36121 [Rubroshorea leprosula]|uniref:Protein kinase domain-containing protein n=1 Tax=Rubroshorea leprosula TaxID=152421 RepID=A0AAV5KQH4_9ROSI|nr:hypothetical protein SLEP1_g36121 [Rubroshorea leprosula]
MNIATLVFALLLLLRIETAVGLTLVKSGCQDSCGDVSIPYPFGIGADCYMNKGFEVFCNETSSPPKTILTSIKMEVLNISLDRSYVHVNSPIISTSCSGRTAGVAVNLTGSPFIFSKNRNKFIAAGCNNRAVMSHIEPMIVGCESTCKDNKPDNTTRVVTMCRGERCCQIMIPSPLHVFNVTFQREDSEECKLAFLVEEQWFWSNTTGLRMLDFLHYMEYVPAVIDWVVTDEEASQLPDRNGSSLRCSEFISHPTVTLNSSVSTVLGVACLLIVIGTWWLYKILKKRRKKKLQRQLFKQNGGLLLQQQLSSTEGNVQKTKIFSSKELKRATDNFNRNRILGQGGQGTVYKGMLVDGRIVAVKKSKVLDKEKVKEFINEVVILSPINHRNVVELLGCCLETKVPMLVYEFIPNGTLFQYIHDENEDFPLSWERRLTIAAEVAAALSYLHSAASNPIYHRDIKSLNILLDEKYRAKVSDFGISRSIAIDQTHLTTNVQGTFGYLDPEYFRSSQFTEKSDVYSFGVVLVELLTGKKPISLIGAEEEEARGSKRESSTFEETTKVAKLAYRCLSLSGKRRPKMIEVAVELEQIRHLLNNSTGQQNHERTSYVKFEVTNGRAGASTDDALSLDLEPLFSSEPWGSLEMQVIPNTT